MDHIVKAALGLPPNTDKLVAHFQRATDLDGPQLDAAIPAAIDAIYAARDAGGSMHHAGAIAAATALQAAADAADPEVLECLEAFLRRIGPDTVGVGLAHRGEFLVASEFGSEDAAEEREARIDAASEEMAKDAPAVGLTRDEALTVRAYIMGDHFAVEQIDALMRKLPGGDIDDAALEVAAAERRVEVAGRVVDRVTAIHGMAGGAIYGAGDSLTAAIAEALGDTREGRALVKS